jgi:DNA-binding transcriptional LysR family regulator
MDTDELSVFCQAAASGSLSAAARKLGITPTVASRRLAALEEGLHLRLVNRTTRSLSLTPEGMSFLPHARNILDAEAAALGSLLENNPEGRSAVTGLLRVTAPASFGRKVVAPLIPRLLSDHPSLRVQLSLQDRLVDIVGEGFDLAVRIGRMRDSSLLARKIADNPRRLCASPDYLARQGAPQRLADLSGHMRLGLMGRANWPFVTATGVEDVRFDGRFESDSMEAVHVACLSGIGIATFSHWDVEAELASGRLVEVMLEDAAPESVAIWIVRPSSRHTPPKIDPFIQALESRLSRSRTS